MNVLIIAGVVDGARAIRLQIGGSALGLLHAQIVALDVAHETTLTEASNHTVLGAHWALRFQLAISVADGTMLGACGSTAHEGFVRGALGLASLGSIGGAAHGHQNNGQGQNDFVHGWLVGG